MSENRQALLEKLAKLEHEQWSHWMKYQHEKRKYSLNYVYAQLWKEWLQKADTPYEKLTEQEKASDRDWAMKVLNVFDEVVSEWKGIFIGNVNALLISKVSASDRYLMLLRIIDNSLNSLELLRK